MRSCPLVLASLSAVVCVGLVCTEPEFASPTGRSCFPGPRDGAGSKFRASNIERGHGHTTSDWSTFESAHRPKRPQIWPHPTIGQNVVALEKELASFAPKLRKSAKPWPSLTKMSGTCARFGQIRPALGGFPPSELPRIPPALADIANRPILGLTSTDSTFENFDTNKFKSAPFGGVGMRIRSPRKPPTRLRHRAWPDRWPVSTHTQSQRLLEHWPTDGPARPGFGPCSVCLAPSRAPGPVPWISEISIKSG